MTTPFLPIAAMTIRNILYDTTGMPYQDAFQESRKNKVYLSAGYGAGKTYSLCMKGFLLFNENKGFPGGILCPTIKMYKRDVYPTMLNICKENGIPFKYNKSDLMWFFPDTATTIYIFHSEDDGASIKGPNLAFMLINEVTLVSQMAFLSALARVRIKNAGLPQIAMSGTPEGFNWTYEYFIENPREDTELIFGNTRLNYHNHASYVANLESSYDPLMQEQYIDGKFVNLKGKRVAWSFDRQKHTAPDVNYLPDLPVRVSLDFNVSPMAATLWQVVPDAYADENSALLGSNRARVRAFDEIEIDNSNTYEMCDTIKDKVPDDEAVIIYPDPAGNARSTKSRESRSDFDILRQEGFNELKYKPSLSVRSCVNALNNMLSKDAIVLNSKKCKQGIADLEQCVFRGNAFEIDKTNTKRSHWLDGMKNFIEYEFPIRAKDHSRVERIR